MFIHTLRVQQTQTMYLLFNAVKDIIIRRSLNEAGLV